MDQIKFEAYQNGHLHSFSEFAGIVSLRYVLTMAHEDREEFKKAATELVTEWQRDRKAAVANIVNNACNALGGSAAGMDAEDERVLHSRSIDAAAKMALQALIGKEPDKCSPFS